MKLLRREFLLGTVMLPLVVHPAIAATPRILPEKARPFPLSSVRLRTSDFARAVEVNRAYLMTLECDRLLHNFRRFAGLEPKAAVYGGWESDTIAGHTLGHYLSALALTHAQTGDAECVTRARYILGEPPNVRAGAGTAMSPASPASGRTGRSSTARRYLPRSWLATSGRRGST